VAAKIEGRDGSLARKVLVLRELKEVVLMMLWDRGRVLLFCPSESRTEGGRRHVRVGPPGVTLGR
jgi:hypothetical protein